MAKTLTCATLIVGAGFSGLGAAIKLAQAGVDDVIILERSDPRRRNLAGHQLSGAPAVTSRRCCIRSRSSRTRPGRGPIRRPTKSATTSRTWPIGSTSVAAFSSVRKSTGLSFDEGAGVWTATTGSRKRFRARTVILASGPLPDSSFPDIRGNRFLRRPQDSQCPVGQGLRLLRKAGRRHRPPAPARSRSSPNWSSRPTS